LNYKFRGGKLVIGLDKGRYSVSNAQFKVTSAKNFGFNAGKNELEYFNLNNNVYSLKAQLITKNNLSVEIIKWNDKECVWNQTAPLKTGKITYSACKLKADNKYAIKIDGQISKTLKSDKEGNLRFDVNAKTATTEIRIQLLND
jgi:hypothetical protein